MIRSRPVNDTRLGDRSVSREPDRQGYQGHIDRWKIAIYKYSTESYTEAELPTSGPRTGTPEKGIDLTFILYAGPSQITD